MHLLLALQSLAQSKGTDWGELVFFAIALIIMIMGAVINFLKDYWKKQKSKQNQQSPNKLNDNLAGMQQRRQDEVRARSGNRIDNREPANLTMAERIARARAKAQYEQRQLKSQHKDEAAQVRNQQHEQRHSHTSSHDESLATERARQQAAAEQQRMRQEKQRALEQQRRQEIQRQQQRQQARQQRALAEQRAAQEREQQQSRRRARQAQAQSQEQASQQSSRSSKSKTAYAPVTALTTGKDIDLHNLSVNDLRQAFILKEVLDRPVGLRDSDPSSSLL